MGILQKRLRDFMNKEIIVVMGDGRAFKGVLGEFDETALLLKDVLETSTSEIRWKSPVVPVSGSKAEKVNADYGGLSFGESEKGIARLKEVLLAMSGVMRVWLWSPEEYQARDAGQLGLKKV